MNGVEVASLYAKLDADVSGLNRGFDQMEKRVNSLDGIMSKVSGMVGGAIKVAAVGVTVAAGALAAGVGSAIKSAADMEQGIANIAATMGLTKDETGKLKGVITDLGLDPKLKVSAVEAANAIDMLGKNGLTLEEIMGGAARSTVLLQNSVGGDFATSADIATDVMSLFNIEASNMTDAVNGIVGVTKSSKFDINDYGLAIAQAGGVASAVGVSFDDFNAAIAAISPSFGSGSDAGTSFKVFLQRLVPTTDKAKKAMMDLGLSTGGDVVEAFFTADGAMRPMEEIAQSLNKAFAGLSDAQRNEAASTLFGTDAMRAALALADAGGKTITDLKGVIGNTSAEEAAATRMDTLSGSWEIFTGIIETLAMGIGDKFLPIARKLVDWAAELAGKFGPSVIAFFGKIADALGALAANAGNWLERINAIFAVQFAILGSENASWGEKMVAIWDMLYIAGMKIWGSLLDGLMKLVPQWLAGLVEWAKGLWQWIVDSAPKALEALWEWAKGLWGWLVDNAPKWAEALWEWAKATWQWIVDVTPAAVAKLQELGWALLQSISLWANDMGPVVSSLWYMIIDIFGAAYGLITGNWTLFWDSIGKIARNFNTNLLPILQAWGASLWQWIVDATPVALATLGEWAGRIFQWVGQALPILINLLLGWGTALVTWIGDAVPRAIAALVAFVQGLRGEGDNTGANAIGQMVYGWGIKLWQWITDTIPKITPAFMEFMGAVQTAGGKIWDALVILAGEWGKTVDFWLQSMGISFVTWKDIAIGAVLAFTVIFWPAISAAFGAVLGAIGAFVAAWAPVLALFAGAILAVALLRTAWESDWGGIQTTTLAVLDFLGEAFAPLLDAIKTFGGDALKEIWAWATGNETSFTAVQKIWEAAKTAFGIVFTAIGEKLVEWGNLAWEWFKEKFPNAAAALALAVDNIKRNFAELWDAAQPLIQKLREAWAAFTDGAAEEGGLLGAAMRRLQILLDGLWTIMITSAGFFVNTIINLFTLIIQMIDGDWTGAWQTAKQIVKGAWDTIVTIVMTAVDTLLGLFDKNRADVVRWFQEIRGTLRAMAEEFRQIGRDIVDGIRSGISSAWNGFTSWLRGLWNSIPENLRKLIESRSPSRVFADIGGDMIDGLAMGITDNASKVYSALDVVSKGMTDSVSKTLDGLYANVGNTAIGMNIKPGQDAIAPFVKLEAAVGTSKADDIFESLRVLASDANQAFRQYGVVDQSILQYTTKLANSAMLNDQGGVGSLKSNIDALVQQLNNTGVANNFGASAKSGLVEFSDYLDILMQGGVYGTEPTTTPTTETGGDDSAILTSIMEVLGIIAEQLRKNGALNHDDLGAVRAYLSNMGSDYAGMVNSAAGLR